MQESLLNQFNNSELLELDPVYSKPEYYPDKNYKLAAERSVSATFK